MLFHDNHMILVNGERIWLLSHNICDSGVALCVSGPEVLLMHEVKATELDGSELKLTCGHLSGEPKKCHTKRFRKSAR